MQILFLYPVPAESRKVYTGYSHGIGYLSAVARKAGHGTSLITFSQRDGDLAAKVTACEPDVIAITATSAQWPLAAWAAGEISRALHDVPIIAGGVHATVATEEVIQTRGIWAACRGEGEEAFLDMLSNLEFGEWEETPGFWTRPQVISGFGPTPIVPDGVEAAVSGEIIRNAPAPLVDLSALPHPDREIFDYQAILDRNRANVGAEFIASRGCPFSCTYCINPVLSEITGGAWKNVRFRDPADIVGEIEEVTGSYSGVKMVGFHDDIFGLDKAWLGEFAALYKERVGLPFWCNERVGTFNEDDVRVLKEAGCFRVHLGVESADEALRREVLSRDISTEAIEESFAMLRRHGIRSVAFNMVGIPGETEESLLATIALNRRIRPDWLLVSIFTPFPGTRLGEIARREGTVSIAIPESYYDAQSALDQPSLSKERLLHYYEHFVDMVYQKSRGEKKA